MIPLVLAAQISAPAIVAHVKENDAKIQDFQAVARMEITSANETRTRTFELSLLRERVGYDARIRLREPDAMAGTEFLIHAEPGKRNRRWAYFPDLDLVREIAGKSEDEPFLGSDVTYADLAGGAHLDDLRHRLLREETIDGEPCYVMEGIPKHRIAYGKLHGYIRKKDFAVIRAEFFDHDGKRIKEARLSEIRDLGGGILLAHRVELSSDAEDRQTVLTFDEVEVNEGLSRERFTEEALGRERKPR